MGRGFVFLIFSLPFFVGCNIGGTDISDPIGEYDSQKDDSPKIVAGFPWFTKYKNPTAYIPLECYTDTGKLKTGEAFANPCYVCHNGGNTPVDNAGDWQNQIDWLRFPSNDNPWLNAVAPEKTFEKLLNNGKRWTEFDVVSKTVKDNKSGKTTSIDDWIRQNNWEKAYLSGSYIGGSSPLGLGKYRLDVPPLYRWNGTDFVRTGFVDSEGFIYTSETLHTNSTNTWWRVYDWKHFPGFFPTNGRLDSAMIRLPEKFRKENGSYSKEVYKINLSILECAVKQITQNCDVEPLDTAILDRYRIQYQTLSDGVRFVVVPDKYIGDASDVDVWQIGKGFTKIGLYPVGTELGHPVYYIDPDWNTRASLGGKTGHLKEFRYMKKLNMQNLSSSEGEEEESVAYKAYDNGLMPNDPDTWLMGGWIEDSDGNLRPQTEEEMAFCMACHGAISGTVDNTFSFWRKLPKSAGWKDTDYGFSRDVYDLKYWAEKINDIEDTDASFYLGNIYGKYRPEDYGEYQFYFTLSNGIDHFRSNREGVCRILGYEIYDVSTDSCKDSNNNSLDFSVASDYIKITSNINILTDSTLIGYLNSDGSIKQSLFLPSRERAYVLNGRYIQVVLSQQFVYGRDLFGKAFGTKDGGNSLEGEDFYSMKLSGPGFEEKGLIAVFRTLLDF
ncbi:hypothetical protein SAMN06265182_0656 [Persephonella hydrogeniphila]|uniref:Uncharacterized protein n=1 Tax=Persephonella hydrogeniphila TaxID=198703 RepID=A0A285NAN7_9AQUI|nr:hypothetical protein [Persephonella hydrogeniphila]SNZ06378.1 hypothetical protein SAMN06265182_0656 [Persephonella hydrogeniphila]